MSTLDYSIFAHPSFQASEYANAILSNQPYKPSEAKNASSTVSAVNVPDSNKEDLSIALAKLSFGVDDVDRKLKGVINSHYEVLLDQASRVGSLEGSVETVRNGLGDIDGSVSRLRSRLSTPYTALQLHATRLQKLQIASDVLRRVARFFMLSRRLEVQMSILEKSNSVSDSAITSGTSSPIARRGVLSPLDGRDGDRTPGGDEVEGKERERTLIKAALSVAEIFALVDSDQPSSQPDGTGMEDISNDRDGEDFPFISLRSLNVIAGHIPTVQSAKDMIQGEMEAMLISGIQELNRPLLSSALLTAHNLRILPETVQSLLNDLIEVVEVRIKNAFDLSSLSREAGIKEPSSGPGSLLYKSRVRTEPTNLTAPQWSTALWARLDGMVNDLGEACIKVYILEKVLSLQKDASTGQSFLEEVMKVLENKPSSSYWSVLARTMERCLREGKSSTFLSQTLTTSYPRLLRLFQDFFSRISLHTDTIYTQTYQSPETVLVLRSVSSFEQAYLQKSITKLNEIVNSSFASSAASYYGGGAYVGSSGYHMGSAGRSPPNEKDGLNIARVVINELDVARFDPLLVKSMARGLGKGLDGLVARVDILVSKDRSATSLVGPTATGQQSLNASLVNALYACWLQLLKLGESYSEPVMKILEPSIQGIQSCYQGISDPLLNAIRLEVSSIISRIHRIDFGGGVDVMASDMGSASPYVKELADKLRFVRTEVLGKYNVGELGQEWGLEIARHVLRTFILHVSIVKPLGESGKLQLTSDMTEVEFALSSLLSEGVAQGHTKQRWKLDVLGPDYRALRALRQLLFLDNDSLANPSRTAGLPPLIVLHHILVLSPLPLPHKLHGWQENQYVRFIEEHTDEEVWSVLEQGLKHWKTSVLSEIEDAEDLGERGAEKKREKEAELRVGEGFVEIARSVLEHARAGV